MKERLRRWYRAIARWLAIVPIRARGLLVVAGGAYVAFRIGEIEADYFLYTAGRCAVALVALCALCTVAGALRVRIALRKRPAAVPPELETMNATRTGFTFPRLALWPLIEVRMRWEQPSGVAVELDKRGRAWAEVITARARGRHARVVRRFTIEDVFGLTAITFSVTFEEPIRIAPRSAIAGAEITMGFGDGDAFSHPSGRQEGDLVEMRAYGHGDSMRHILWKTFARSRRLLVRMPERAIAPAQTAVAFLVAGAGDEPTCAAARLYIERQLFGRDFVFCADGAAAPARDAATALEHIIDSSAQIGDGGTVLDKLGGQVDPARLSACAVFAPPVDGVWRERLMEFARKLPGPPTVIIGVDGELGPARRTRLVRLLVRTPSTGDADSRALDAVPALRTALEQDGLRVQVIHRSTGQVL